MPALPSFLVRSEPAGGREGGTLRDRGWCVGRWDRQAIGWQAGGPQNRFWMVPIQVYLGPSGCSKQGRGKHLGQPMAMPRMGWRLLIGTGTDWSKQMLASWAGFWSPWLCQLLFLYLLHPEKVQGTGAAEAVVLRELWVALFTSQHRKISTL